MSAQKIEKLKKKMMKKIEIFRCVMQEVEVVSKLRLLLICNIQIIFLAIQYSNIFLKVYAISSENLLVVRY